MMIINPASGRPFRASSGIVLETGSGRPDAVAEAFRLTREDRLYTLEEQVAFAVRLGFGDAKALCRLHHKWREVGVLHGPDRRQSRKGGAGLWNREQVRLWLNCLRRRRDLGAQGLPRNLTAIPVGLWLWGQPGVPLEHARKAFHTRWTAYLEHPIAKGKEARKSLKRKGISAETRRLLGRNPGWRLLEDLRNVEPQDDGRVEPPINRQEFITRLEQESARPPNEAQRIAQGMYASIATAALALANLDRLCNSNVQEWPALWEWARLIIGHAWSDYVTQGEAKTPRDLYDPSVEAFAVGADRNLLFVLGIGLNPNRDALRADGLPLPPASLPGLRNRSA